MPHVHKTGTYPKHLNDVSSLFAKTPLLSLREEELQQLEVMVQFAHEPVLVKGIPGCGKQSFIKNYILQNDKYFDHIVWLDYIKNIQESFLLDDDLTKNLDIVFAHEENVPIRFHKILNKLTTLKGNNLLVINDPFEKIVKSDLDAIKQLHQKWKIIVTSNNATLYNEFINLKPLTKDRAKQLFYSFYTSDKNEKALDEIIKQLDCHILGIKMVAKYANYYNIDLEDLRVFIEKACVEIAALKLTGVSRSYASLFQRIFAILTAIFQEIKWTEEEQYVLKQLTTLPSVYITFQDLLAFFSYSPGRLGNPRYLQTLLGNLERRGWIFYNKVNGAYKLHRIPQTVVKYFWEPSVNDLNLMVKAMAERIAEKTGTLQANENFHLLPYAYNLLTHIVSSSKEVAQLQYQLALAYHDAGDIFKARNLLSLALSILENKQDPEDDATVASWKCNLALMNQDLNDFEYARVLLEEALIKEKKIHGYFHPYISSNLSNLAMVYKDMNNLPKAILLLEEAKRIDDKIYSEEHPIAAITLNNMAVVYQEMGKFKEAMACQEQAMLINARCYGASHIKVTSNMFNLAGIHYDLKEYEAARSLMENSLAMDIRRFGEKHPRVADGWSNLAMVLMQLNELKPATRLMEDAYRFDRDNFGIEHIRTGIRLYNLSEVYLRSHDMVKGKRAIIKAYQIFKRQYGMDHPFTQKTAEKMGRF